MMSAKTVLSCAFVLVSSALILQGCGGGGGGGGDDKSGTISGIAEKNKDLSTLVTALKAADLVETLEGAGPFTVFAPSDAAFSEIPAAELTYLLHTKDKLQEVLEYHVASGRVLSSNLTDGEKIKMLKGGDVTITITKEDNKTFVKVNGATVTTPNVEASNGVVHIIDKVLIPDGFTAPNIPALASAANLTTLATAISAANLTKDLSGAGPLTVFAPTNAAFAALPKGVLQALLKPENIKDLQKVLTYHVANGEVLAADLIKKGDQKIPTLEGQDVNITISGSKVSVNTANVVQADNFAVNGVVHVIDAVLLPPGFVPPSASVKNTALERVQKSPSVTIV